MLFDPIQSRTGVVPGYGSTGVVDGLSWPALKGGVQGVKEGREVVWKVGTREVGARAKAELRQWESKSVVKEFFVKKSFVF